MQYLMLIYHAEADFDKIPAAEKGELYKSYVKFTQEIKDRGTISAEIRCSRHRRRRRFVCATQSRWLRMGRLRRRRNSWAGTTWWKPRTWMRLSELQRGYPVYGTDRSKCVQSLR